MGCPAGLTGTSSICRGVGLSVFTRYERGGGTGTRLDEGAASVKALVLHTVDADVRGLALFVEQDPTDILEERED